MTGHFALAGRKVTISYAEPQVPSAPAPMSAEDLAILMRFPLTPEQKDQLLDSYNRLSQPVSSPR